MLYSSVFQMYSSVSPMIYGLPFWHYFFRYAHNLGIHINIFGHCFAITKTPKTQIFLLNSAAHFIFTLFHFFCCFHNKNQLTFFYFLSYYLTKDSSGPEWERPFWSLYTSISYFVITLSYFWLLLFQKANTKGNTNRGFDEWHMSKVNMPRRVLLMLSQLFGLRRGLSSLQCTNSSQAASKRKRPASQHQWPFRVSGRRGAIASTLTFFCRYVKHS